MSKREREKEAKVECEGGGESGGEKLIEMKRERVGRRVEYVKEEKSS